MGDGFKISKDKRHRSSSSIAGVALEGTRSERKLDLRGSIAEVDDQFTLAEARCDVLQEKIDLVKNLKRKKKLKKRSMTRVAEQPTAESVTPFITIRTQPKKKVPHQSMRLRSLEVPPNPIRGYLDQATIEQHKMIGQVRGYNQTYNQPQNQDHAQMRSNVEQTPATRLRQRRTRPDGDSAYGHPVQKADDTMSLEVACGDDDVSGAYTVNVANRREDSSRAYNKEERQITKLPSAARRRHVPRDIPKANESKTSQDGGAAREVQASWLKNTVPANRRRVLNRLPQNTAAVTTQPEERPVVELFKKHRTVSSADDVSKPQMSHPQQLFSADKTNKRAPRTQRLEDRDSGLLGSETPSIIRKEKDLQKHPRRIKYRSHRYELPTVASQMKQAGIRYYYGTANKTNIPFVVSKSTAPSHNIGVNIQQVLNGLKIQQPLSGIPLTIALHMGLGHIPFYGLKNIPTQPSLDNREMNAIRLGRRLLRLPSYKYMSYNRLLDLYREGDGMVPRFLRSISRPHYFYTSMYNLATRDDFDAATSKGRGGSQEAKQSLAEYASLYREYAKIDKRIKDGNCDPEMERRKEELTRQLAAREDHIRSVVQEYRASTEAEPPVLRATASTAGETYRHSSFKLNRPDMQ